MQRTTKKMPQKGSKTGGGTLDENGPIWNKYDGPKGWKKGPKEGLWPDPRPLPFKAPNGNPIPLPGVKAEWPDDYIPQPAEPDGPECEGPRFPNDSVPDPLGDEKEEYTEPKDSTIINGPKGG